MKKMKRLFIVLLSAAIAFTLSVTPAWAANEDPVSLSRASGQDILRSEQAVYQAIRDNLVSRNGAFFIEVDDTLSAYFHAGQQINPDHRDPFLGHVFDYTGDPEEGAYLFLSTGHLEVSEVVPLGDHTEIRLVAAYYSDSSMERAVDSEISRILSSLGVSGSSDFEKVSAVYHYIIDHIAYDYAHLGDDTYFKQFTAYAALVEGTAVCHGYSAVFSRLMTALGVENEAITSNSLNHSWNIVKLDGKFYYVDTTWDSTNGGDQYFLKGSKDFLGHGNSDDQFSDPEFAALHPLADFAYHAGGVDSIEIPGYAPDQIMKSSSGKKIPLRSDGTRAKVFVFGASWCPFTPMLLDTLKGKSFDGIDIYVALDDCNSVPKDWETPGCVTFCCSSSESSGICDAREALERESGTLSVWVSYPTVFMVNPANQIVFVNMGYFEEFPRTIENYLGKNAPDTSAYHEHSGSHRWEVLNNIKTPTASQAGIVKHRCRTCGKVEEIVVPAGNGTVSGKCGDHAKWVFDSSTGELRISGSGEMYDMFSIPYQTGWVSRENESPAWSTSELYIFKEDVKKVVIEEGITRIGGLCFWRFRNLKEIYIPLSVKAIGGTSEHAYGAFGENDSLKKVFYAGTKKQWKAIHDIASELSVLPLVYQAEPPAADPTETDVPETDATGTDAATKTDPVPASPTDPKPPAEDPVSDEDDWTVACGDHAGWTFTKKTGLLEIKGKGRLYDNIYIPNDLGWVLDRSHAVELETTQKNYLYADQVKKVRIDEGVTYVGGLFLYYFDNLKEVYIPSTVKTLGCKGYEVFSEGSRPNKLYYGGTSKQWKKVKKYEYSCMYKDIRVICVGDGVKLKTGISSKTFRKSAVKSKKQTFTIKASSAFGKITYKSLNTKYVTVSSSGKVTVKKGTPKGTYKIKVTSSSEYGNQTKTVKVIVK